MKTCAELRAMGFSLKKAEDAVDCTELSAKEPFYFYNPRFHDDIESVMQNMETAHQTADGYRIIVAGVHFLSEEEFPLQVFTDVQMKKLNAAYGAHHEAKEEVRVAMLKLTEAEKAFKVLAYI